MQLKTLAGMEGKENIKQIQETGTISGLVTDAGHASVLGGKRWKITS